jgi:hypothetical protein
MLVFPGETVAVTFILGPYMFARIFVYTPVVSDPGLLYESWFGPVGQIHFCCDYKVKHKTMAQFILVLKGIACFIFINCAIVLCKTVLGPFMFM